MSLNQLTNPNSQFSIYGKTVTIPPLPLPDGVTGFVTVNTPAVTFGPTQGIGSAVYRLGDLYTVICRAKFTAAANGNIVFDLNIPGFVFAEGEAEASLAFKNGVNPDFAPVANATGMVVDCVMVEPAPGQPAVPRLKLSYTRYNAGLAQVAAANGLEYDISFTMNVVGTA